MAQIRQVARSPYPITIEEISGDGRDELGVATNDILRIRNKAGDVIASLDNLGVITSTGGTVAATFTKDGALSVSQGVKYFYVPRASKIVGVGAAVNTPSLAQSIVCDVNLNGRTIFPSSGSKPAISPGLYKLGSLAIPDALINPSPPIPPGQNYTIPVGAISCSTQGQIDSALATYGSSVSIVIEDGTYTRSGYCPIAWDHKIFARNAGKAVLQYGFQSGGGTVEIHGTYFDVTNSANTLVPGIIHLWGTATNWKITDCWFDGHFVNDNAIVTYAPNGHTIERIWIRNFLDNGLRLDDNAGFSATPVIQRVWDIDVANVYRLAGVGRGNSNGTGEAGVFIGHKVTDGVNRIKVKNTGWQGIALNNNCRDTTFSDLDIDSIYGIVPPGPGESGVGIYIERSCHNLIFQRFVIGPDLYIGVNGEWNAGAAGTAGINNVRFSNGTISATRAVTPSTPTRGIYADEGSDALFVDNVRFIGMNWACIGFYLTTNTPLTNFTNNDYSQRGAGAKRVVSQYANVAAGSLVDLVSSDGISLKATTPIPVSAGDLISVDIDQVGVGTTGSDLEVVVLLQ